MEKLISITNIIAQKNKVLKLRELENVESAIYTAMAEEFNENHINYLPISTKIDCPQP